MVERVNGRREGLGGLAPEVAALRAGRAGQIIFSPSRARSLQQRPRRDLLPSFCSSRLLVRLTKPTPHWDSVLVCAWGVGVAAR